jgi:hypothetical protein
MNWKATLVLLVVAAGVATVAYINPFEAAEEVKVKSPWFYQVSFDDINSISITHNQNQVSFTKTPPYTWTIDGSDSIPPDHFRWGGVVLLVSGPQTRRDFSTVRATIDDPAEYGLDTPQLTVNVGLTADRSVEFMLGGVTADDSFNYAQVSGFPQLFLIAKSWGDVLGRLADEPPIPKWYVARDIESIVEVNVFEGDIDGEDGAVVVLTQVDGKWRVRDKGIDSASRPLDEDKWSDFIPLMVGPPEILIEDTRVDSRDYTRWGIEDQGPSIEIRFEGLSERGTKYIDGVLFQIGDKTEDGQHYFATSASDQVINAVLKLDAVWTDALYGLLDDIPYGDSTN